MKRKKQAHHKIFCPSCLYSGKGMCATCPKCKEVTVHISHKFHLPSMNASKDKWKKFFNDSGFLGTGYLNEEAIRNKVLETVNNKTKRKPRKIEDK